MLVSSTDVLNTVHSFAPSDMILWNGEKLLVKLQTKKYAILLHFRIASWKNSVHVKAMPKYIVFMCNKNVSFICKMQLGVRFT